MRNIKSHMKILAQNPYNKRSLEEVFRLVHTLKSQNFAMGLPRSAELCKSMELIMRMLRETKHTFSQTLDFLFTEALKHLEISLDHIEKGGDEEDPTVTTQKLKKFTLKNYHENSSN